MEDLKVLCHLNFFNHIPADIFCHKHFPPFLKSVIVVSVTFNCLALVLLLKETELPWHLGNSIKGKIWGF